MKLYIGIALLCSQCVFASSVTDFYDLDGRCKTYQSTTARAQEALSQLQKIKQNNPERNIAIPYGKEMAHRGAVIATGGFSCLFGLGIILALASWCINNKAESRPTALAFALFLHSSLLAEQLAQKIYSHQVDALEHQVEVAKSNNATNGPK